MNKGNNNTKIIFYIFKLKNFQIKKVKKGYNIIMANLFDNN